MKADHNMLNFKASAQIQSPQPNAYAQGRAGKPQEQQKNLSAAVKVQYSSKGRQL
jgi:hypothetical protein